jgi:alpha-mannosidase
VTWKYGVNLTAPDTYTEEVGAVLHVKKKAAGGNYSDSAANSRYDWTSLNHFADMSGSGSVGITLSNADLYALKLGNSTVSTLDTITPEFSVLIRGNIAAGAGVNNQGDETYYLHRFALRSHDAYDPVAAMKFSLEHQNPLTTASVTGTGSAYPADSYSLLSLSNPKVLLWALKPAEEGIAQGMILRTWNLAGTTENADLSVAAPISQARKTTHLETDLADIPVTNSTISFASATQQLKTHRLLSGPGSKCDINGDGSINVLDLQRLVNAILTATGSSSEDLNGDGQVNVLDLQILVNVILGTGVCP